MNLGGRQDPNDERVINSSLCSIQEILLSIGGKSLSDFSLPSPQILPDQPRINREYASEINYSSTDLTAIVNDNLQNFTPEQREIFDIVVQSVLNNEGKIFFLDAPGGTGKTYLTKAILAEFRRQGKIALAVASSGIAATLLPGGKTAHTMFKIPIPIPNPKNVTVLFSGDFRQTLPVVTRGTRADEINASLKRSYLWPQIIRMRLTINMRAQLGGNSQAQTFSNILLEIGEGTLPEDEGQVVIPDILGRVVSSEDELINSVFGDVSSIIQHDNSWLCERAILTPKNEQAAALNAKILAEIGGDEVVYTSYNSVVHEDDATNYPIEFLSSLTASSLPAHKITLKVGVPIMLLRNLTPPKLCNGTRLKVSALQRNLIHAEILTGCGAGETVFIPRIPLIPNNFPFEFKRTQFPISLCFAMTINKYQGQTLKAAGVDLRSNCFSHGQLYVACSREILLSIGGKSLSDFSLPSPQILPDQPRINREYASEINYSSTDLTAIVNDNLQNFTPEQREIFDIVVQSVLNNEGKIFFLDAPGGTGKTYLTKAILAEFRRQGKIALAVASSGIAATLLPGGKTAHTMFKIPIPIPNPKNVTVLFSGDFRQTLPVVTRGTRADEINASLKRSYLWPQIIRMRLTINMRAQLGGNSQAQTFSNILLEIGEGTLPEDEGQVVIPDILGRVVSSEDELINSVFGDVSSIIQHDNSWLCERAILTPKNEQAAALNAKILAEIGGDEVVYTSYNSVVHEDDATNYPIEFLSSLTASGLPAHKITLKVGVPIMLLRNLTPPKLCNGTRLKVSALQRNLIHAEILTGCGAGETVFIPRIPLIPNNFPFEFKRTQFPISLCFAMTINKYQGQTLKAAGVDLRSNCFSHGQLYVACSRVSSAEQLFVLAPTGKTTNVVYRDIL